MDNIYTLVGLLFTFVGLVYTGEQIRRSRKISLADFLLRLDDQLKAYDDIHMKLHHRGEWSKNSSGPASEEEWVLVEKYMGLFERIYVIVETKIVPLDVIDRLYGYRVSNIMKNDIIRNEQLVKYKKYWSDFIALTKLLNLYEENT